jgi:hypothetical protein
MGIVLILQEGETTMSNFKQSELNWIREVVAGHNMSAAKLASYAEQVQDPQLKQMFKTSAGGAKTAASNLLNML